MGFRFRKSFKIAPGIRLNLSKSGTSVTLGGRGASVNIGGKRPRATVGIPGTGVSYTSPLNPGQPAPPQSSGTNVPTFVVIAVIAAAIALAYALY